MLALYYFFPAAARHRRRGISGAPCGLHPAFAAGPLSAPPGSFFGRSALLPCPANCFGDRQTKTAKGAANSVASPYHLMMRDPSKSPPAVYPSWPAASSSGIPYSWRGSSFVAWLVCFLLVAAWPFSSSLSFLASFLAFARSRFSASSWVLCAAWASSRACLSFLAASWLLNICILLRRGSYWAVFFWQRGSDTPVW